MEAATGALSSIGTPVAAGIQPQSVIVDPSGRFAYVANNASSNVSMYTIDATTGVLTSIGPAVAAGGSVFSTIISYSFMLTVAAQLFTNPHHSNSITTLPTVCSHY